MLCYKRNELQRKKLDSEETKNQVYDMEHGIVQPETMRKKDIKSLKTFEVWIRRGIERVSWLEPTEKVIGPPNEGETAFSSL